MINEIKLETETRMKKCLESLAAHLSKIRTGRAHPGVLDGIMVPYYGSDTPLSQLANINVEDGRTLTITAWEKNITPDIERAIIAANIGLNPMSAGTVIRVPMPALTEETRKNFIKQAKHEAEGARVAVRGVRRDANAQLKDLLKSKDVSEDEERRAQDDVQKLTDRYIAEVDSVLTKKEKELMEF